ncbi:lignostilbene dioxygenase [Dactylonectria estremocensis]|uniref:Lignostilbene dioxygenase n=1 Tax=Dactylonectria estremocensis TaxID=1079267 RepID=A0A9P9DF73_9HYPO|nr:lignostilbene dioxygenase [Dactylonectria estremocensis]
MTSASVKRRPVLDKARSTDWTKILNPQYGLSSPWSSYYTPAGTSAQGRWEGELDSLVVYGEVPKEIDGTFYRLLLDPQHPPHPDNPFIDGDANICAFRFHNGQVDMKLRYVETERYLLERKANQRLFHIYRNPYSWHPCVRMANDSTGNTNIVPWAGHLLALSERGLPWAVDPETLETRCYDPFGGQVKAKTFTAHPKVDPYQNEMVVWGYEAKGLGTPDICFYTVDPEGAITGETWIKDEMGGMAHDAWITENWIVMSSMPFKVNSDEEMKAGSQHWEWVPDRPAALLVAPRKPTTPLPAGWKVGEARRYTWDNGVIFHTGAAWEDEDGTLKLESHFVTFNFFHFFNPPGMQPPAVPLGDWVRWTINLSQPNNSRLQDPDVLLPWISDFPKTDERFLTRKQRIVYLISCDAGKEIKPGTLSAFNTIVKLDTETLEMMVFDPGENGRVAEPVFVPRSDDAPEGDGWVIGWTDSAKSPRGELVVLDTNDFSKPVAVIHLPFAMRTQVHGNWVPNPTPGTPMPRLTKPLNVDVTPSNNGVLDRIKD